MNLQTKSFNITIDKDMNIKTEAENRDELILDIDDLYGIIDQVMASHLGLADPISYFQEIEIINWQNKQI